MSDVFRFVHPRIVGTFVTVNLSAPAGAIKPRQADFIDDAVADEFERLEQILSVYRPDSELERWKRGEVSEPSIELRTALGEALTWQHRSGGAFHTASGTVSDVWRRAADRGSPPTPDELAAALAATANDPYVVDAAGVPRPGARASSINLNAFAKGWIVDRVVATTLEIAPDLNGITINAGGDLCHRGTRSIVVDVENPLRPYDNEPPIARLSIASGAVATSGRARKGFEIGGQFFSHVIDPRTAMTVDTIASITVVADDAATADVLATVIGLADPADAIGLADDYQVATMVVLPDGSQLRNRRFDEMSILGGGTN